MVALYKATSYEENREWTKICHNIKYVRYAMQKINEKEWLKAIKPFLKQLHIWNFDLHQYSESHLQRLTDTMHRLPYGTDRYYG